MQQDQPIHRILDDRKRAEIIGLLTLGCSRRKAAQCVGYAPSTITRMVQRDPEFAAQVARAEQNIETLALANIRAACKQERYWRASAWVLEHRNPEDFATRPLDVMTKEQVDQLLTQFTEVILRELPLEQWQHITTAFDNFMEAAQQEIRASQPCQAQEQATNGSERIPTERKLAPASGPAPTQHPSNDHRNFTTPTQSTTPETATTSPCNTRPKNATPTQGRCTDSVAPSNQ